MQDTHVDRLTRCLTVEESRRRMLVGVVAVASMMVTSAPVLGAKGKGKGKKKGKGQGHGAAGAPGQNKVGLCHRDDETGLHTYLEVPSPALKGHQKHGDVLAPNGATDCDALNEPAPEPEE